MPVRLNGEAIGAAGVAGSSKENDTDIVKLAAAALSPSPRRPP
jgi:glc operon protein GlcG